jgi:serine phosphatase RsbU (regulator of sigma subunit)
MVIFTDGTAEMRTENSSFIGSEYIYDALSDTKRDSDELLDELFAMPPGSGEYIMNDDVTILSVDFK